MLSFASIPNDQNPAEQNNDYGDQLAEAESILDDHYDGSEDWGHFELFLQDDHDITKEVAEDAVWNLRRPK